jgi:hypothetical protein
MALASIVLRAADLHDVELCALIATRRINGAVLVIYQAVAELTEEGGC